MAPEDEDETRESKPPPPKGSAADEEHKVIHAAPSAPDLDAIPVPAHPDDVSEAPRVDAMGQDKRRQVVGKTYGPTTGRQAAVYLTVLGVIIVLFIGGGFVVGELDEAPKDNPAAAPWAQPDSPQTPPRLPE